MGLLDYICSDLIGGGCVKIQGFKRMLFFVLYLTQQLF